MLIRCWRCGRVKEEYRNGECQSCYRGNNSKFCYYKYKDEEIKPRLNSKAWYICEEMINEKMSATRFVKEKGTLKNINSVRYVRLIVERYLEKCDTLGRGKNE